VIVSGGMTVAGGVYVAAGGMTVYGLAYFESPSPQLITSDRRLKTGIKRLERSLSKIAQLRGVYFSWVKDDEKTGLKLDDRRHVG
jgi:hypothetical protein